MLMVICGDERCIFFKANCLSTPILNACFKIYLCSMASYLDGLNPQQKEAVLHKDGPIMIIAGAGSGKTKVLTTRITHLMSAHGVDAFNILALTFTNLSLIHI